MNNLPYLPIIRKTFPSSIQGELISEMPMASVNVTTENKIGFFWEGGYQHDFVHGFFFSPWKLKFKIFKRTNRQTEKSIFNLYTDKIYISITLLSIKSEKLYNLLRRKNG